MEGSGILPEVWHHGAPHESRDGTRHSPFPTEAVDSLRNPIICHLEQLGIPLERTEDDRADTPIDFRFTSQMLKASRDPDRGVGDFGSGVRVGRGARLPRLPALYRPNRRWKLGGPGNPVEYLEVEHDPETAWRSTYPTVSELAEKVEDVLEDQVRRGQVLKHTEEEAKRLFPGLVIAPLGANKKEKSDGTPTARVLHDGSNRIPANRRTRVQDQERCPMASDLKHGMREKAKRGEKTFALTADVKGAHRQIPVVRQDWRLLGCRVRPGTFVYINKVGTFGISSASCHWSRIGSGIGRFVQYVVGSSAATWIMLVADDCHLETRGTSYRAGLIAFFVVCSLLGVPLSWGKTSGGDTLTWVGFELFHKSYRLGVSQRRAEWICRWCKEMSTTESVNTAVFEEGLGRISDVAGALEYERASLSPLF